MIYKLLLLSFLFLVLLASSIQARSPWLGQDKVMHFLTSAYLTYWNYGLYHDVMDNSQESSLIVSVSVTAFLGTGKELSDKHLKKTRFSWHDMAYNGAGIIFGVYLIKNMR
jgi:uncharacterized protein YfiM (DUF2279 family)